MLDDPRPDPDRCRLLVDPGGPGANGRAAVQLADGLRLGRAGDLDGAITAFDRAVAILPKLAFA